MNDVTEVSEFAVDAYERLFAKVSGTTSALPAAKVPGREDSYFAVDSAGNFYLLVQVTSGMALHEMRLDALRISAGNRFNLTSENADELRDVPFASVVLNRDRLELLTAFGTLSSVLLATLPHEPSTLQLRQFLDDFLDLFAPRKSAAREVVLGLWGELWVMTQAADVPAMVRAWHMESTDRYDFSFRNFRLEVKTTEQLQRAHSFSLSQLGDQPTTTWIASVTAVSDPAGLRVVDLLSGILSELGPSERQAFSRLCLQSLGGDLEAAADFRFSPSGPTPLAVIPAACVPRVVVPEGALISRVRFVADISSVIAASASTLSALLATNA